MDKDRTTATSDARAHVVIEHDDDVVEVVVAPKALGASGIRVVDVTVVVAIGRRIAPSIVARDAADGKTCRRPAAAISPPPDLPETPDACWRGAVPFPLAASDAAPAQRTGAPDPSTMQLAAPRRPAQKPQHEPRTAALLSMHPRCSRAPARPQGASTEYP